MNHSNCRVIKNNEKIVLYVEQKKNLVQRFLVDADGKQKVGTRVYAIAV